jgi:hypothetical protein
MTMQNRYEEHPSAEPSLSVLRRAARALRKDAAYCQALLDMRAEGDFPDRHEQVPVQHLSWTRHELLKAADWLEYRADMKEVA